MYPLPSYDSASNAAPQTIMLTPSKLGCLCLCAHRHQLRYELGYHAPHGLAEDSGTLNHCLLRLLHQCWVQKAIILTSDQEVYEWVRPLAYKHACMRFAHGRIREILIESACRDLVRYVKAERDHLSDVVESESSFRFHFTSINVLLAGRVDAVLRCSNSEYVLRDFKSRHQEEDTGVVNHETLAVCALAWEKQRSVRVNRIEVYNLKTGEIDRKAFDTALRTKATQTLQQVADALRRPERARRRNDDEVCARCDERSICRSSF